MSNRLTITAPTSTQKSLTNNTSSSNVGQRQLSPELLKRFVIEGCAALSQYKSFASPLIGSSNFLLNSELKNKIEVSITCLRDLAVENNSVIKHFFITSVAKVICTPNLHEESLKIAFSLFKTALIHLLSTETNPQLYLIAANTCITIIRYESEKPINKTLCNEYITLIEEIYEKYDDQLKVDFIISNLQLSSKLLDELYLELILKSSNEVRISIIHNIISSLKSHVPLPLVRAIEDMLGRVNCTSNGLIYSKKQLLNCKERLLVNASPLTSQSFLRFIMENSGPAIRELILSSKQFQSLILSPKTSSEIRIFALNLIEQLIKNASRAEKTTIHSFLVEYLLSFTTRQELRDKILFLCTTNMLSTKQEIVDIIGIRTILHDYDNYPCSFVKTFKLLSDVLEGLADPNLEAFTILKIYGLHPELKELLKCSFNS